jgi:branched-chain amino acid transport system permease protein
MNPLPEPIPYRRLYRGPLMLLAAFLVFPLCLPASHSYLLPLAQLCGIYGIIVTGLTLLMGFTGQISLGHAGLYGFGAYTAAVLVTALKCPLWLALPAALGASALLAWITGFMVLRLKGHYLALATLCLGVILWEFITKATVTGGAAGLYDLPELSLFGLPLKSAVSKFYFIWGILLLVVMWALNLAASPSGRSLRAIRGDEDAAASLGISVFAVKLKVYVISGLLAGLAGILYAFVYTPSYLGPEEFGLTLSVTLVAMAVIGGMGSVWGGLAGAIVMTSLHELITLAGEKLGSTDIARYEQLVYGLLLIAMLQFCPRGLAPTLHGFLRARWNRWRKHGGGYA